MKLGRIAVLGAILVVGSVALAADDTGWYVGIEGASVKAGQEDVVLGTPYSEVSGGPGGKLITLDLGSGTAYGVSVGYKNEKSNCWVSYWGYDEDASKTALDEVNGFLPGWGNSDFADDFANRLDGTLKLKTSTIDVVWARPFATGDKSQWDWQLGLRSWSLEERSIRTTDIGFTEGPYDDQLDQRSKASGVGLVAGIGGSYHFSKRFWGSSTLRFGMLTGDVDVDYTEDAFGDVLVSGLDSVDRNFFQVEFDARINANIIGGLDGFVGYTFKNYGKAATTVTYTDDVNEGLIDLRNDDVSFSGINAGLSYRF